MKSSRVLLTVVLAMTLTSSALAANFNFGFDKVVFVKRFTYQSSHYYTDFIDGCKFYGGGLCTLDIKTGKVTDIVPKMNKGIFGRFDLSFDAKKIVFDWKADINTGFYIYEVNVNGTGLRQLTFPPKDEAALMKKYRNHKGGNWCKHALRFDEYKSATEDMHPCYLPDGGIAFISTRCHYGILCDGPDRLAVTVLYRMDKDGKNMEKLTNSGASEASPSVMSDGRILYTRWEYVDKGTVPVKCLWSMRPDGTSTIEVALQEITFPDTFIHARQIASAPSKVAFLGAPHCPQSGVGTVMVVDTNKNIRLPEAYTYITPNTDVKSVDGFGIFAFKTGDKWKNDRSGTAGKLYMDPYPLSEKQFLVSMKPAGMPWNQKDGWRLCVLDDKGNDTELYRDEKISCWQPYPLKARKKPPVPVSPIDRRLAAKKLARVNVTDVYMGMTGVKRGTIKYLRINEQIPRPWRSRRLWGGDESYQQHAVISRGAHHAPKAQWGVVPVEADGSAHFLVPADRSIFLQALDENYMEVQRQRTYINYRPGESRTCIGCHEPYGSAPAASGKAPIAMKRKASIAGPQPGEKTGRRTIFYPVDVQPVLDKHCIKCHGEKKNKKPKGDLYLTGEPTNLFSKSYEQLTQGNLGRVKKKYMWYIGEHAKTGNVKSVAPKTLGSHSSLLVAMLAPDKVKLADPKDAKRAAELVKKHKKKFTLTQGELIKITTWVDSNAQFYGSYWGRRNKRYADHPNYRSNVTFDQAINTIPPLPDNKR